MTMDSELIAQQAAERRLREKRGKPLEANRAGEFVAVSLDGEILLGERERKLFHQALTPSGETGSR